MSRIDLNLARKPFVDTRKLDLTVALFLVAALLLGWFNVAAWLRERSEGQGGESIVRQEERIAALTREIEKTEADAKTAVSEETREEVEGINLLIAERTFSWERMLERLESAVPPTVAFSSITPSIRAEGATVDLALNGISLDREGLLTLIENLYGDPAFASPFPSSESSQEASGNPDGRIFALRVGYDATKALAAPPPRKPAKPDKAPPPVPVPTAASAVARPSNAEPPAAGRRQPAPVQAPTVTAPLPAPTPVPPPAVEPMAPAPRMRPVAVGPRRNQGPGPARLSPAGADDGIAPGAIAGPGAPERRGTPSGAADSSVPAPKDEGGDDK
jgi:Tfp pilus assembly protein PilN